MTKFEFGSINNYRDNLAGKLKEIRKSNTKKSHNLLNEARSSSEYKYEESLFNERKSFYQKYKSIMFEIKTDMLRRLKENPEDETNIIYDALYKLYKNLYSSEDWNSDISLILSILSYNGNDVTSWRFEPLQQEKQLIIKELFPENKRDQLVDRMNDLILKNDYIRLFRTIELLGYVGVSGSLFEKIKYMVVESGDMCFLNKVSREFNYDFNRSDIANIAQIGFINNSAYDLNEAIKKVPDMDKEIIIKRDELIENSRKKYETNKNKVIAGIKENDLFIHTSPTDRLDNIIKHGILSIMDQRKMGVYEFGFGPDLQKILGCFDCVSIYNLYKGGTDNYDKNGNKKHDSELYNDFKFKVQVLMREFQLKKGERYFLTEGSSSSYNSFKITDREKLAIYENRFTKLIYSCSNFDQYVDPKDLRLDVMERITKYKNDGSITRDLFTGEPVFPMDFYDDVENDEDKLNLLKEIKNLRHEKYTKSVAEKDYSVHKNDLYRVLKLQDNITGDSRVDFIVDPKLNASFVLSGFACESFIDDKISPEKIVGINVVDEYVKRYCVNNGMIGFKVVETSEIKTTDEVILTEQDRSIICVPIFD